MNFPDDQRDRFVTVKANGELIELPVQRLKKAVQTDLYRSRDCVAWQGKCYLLPEQWPWLAHVFEIQ